MGLHFFGSCSTNYTPSAPAPNPNPGRWSLIEVKEFKNSYVLKVRYPDATNFEGVKVMVYKGPFPGLPKRLDPHFTDSTGSPVARFRPDAEGMRLAVGLAKRLSGVKKVKRKPFKIESCDPEIRRNGKTVYHFDNGPGGIREIEIWVRHVARMTRARLDWLGGLDGYWAGILCLGDDATVARVRAWIEKHPFAEWQKKRRKAS